MGKKQRRNRPTRDEYNDKPAYAADVPVVVKPAKQVEPSESAPPVREWIDAKTMGQLARLKEEMQIKAASAPVPHLATKPTSVAPRLNQPDSEVGPDKDKSFKELFDPEPETEESFADILQDSKLDWRTFK